jgi:hypothetical protein
METDIAKLFGPDYLEAFENGAASWLVKRRNRNLGAMMVSEHCVFYIQILYRMLCFRREHELEPLNDDIFNAVATVQEAVSGEEYSVERFNQHMNQLIEWRLIRRRMEKERLRGYRDVRRDKFRYSLEDDALSFLIWLEERLQQDVEGDSHDTRNLLDDVRMRLKETAGELDRIDAGMPGNGENSSRIRSALYYFGRINDLTAGISQRLIALNSRLCAFLVSTYTLDEARKVIDELELYLSSYLREVLTARTDILNALEDMIRHRAGILEFCYNTLEAEERKAGILFRSRRKSEPPALALKRLIAFYDKGGQLDRLCHRINDASMKVWGKISAHLRELERKNTRLDDLRARIAELVELPEDRVPEEFMLELLSPAQMLSDRNYWDEFEKATPPQPRREAEYRQAPPEPVLKTKSGQVAPVQSMEESLLAELQNWLKLKYRFNGNRRVDVATAGIESVEDFRRVLEVGKRGILARGRSLEKINFELKVDKKICTLNGPDGCSLEFNKMSIRELNDGKTA